MSADKELWKTGKSVKDDGGETEDDDTLDLSSPSPDTEEDIEKVLEEDNWLPLLKEEDSVSTVSYTHLTLPTILLV